MKTSKKASKSKSVRKAAVRPAAKVKQAPAKAAKSAKAASAKSPKRTAKSAKASAPAPAPRAKPVHEWAEAIKKAALQNKQGHNPWPGASTPWKGKQRPD